MLQKRGSSYHEYYHFYDRIMRMIILFIFIMIIIIIHLSTIYQPYMYVHDETKTGEKNLEVLWGC